MCIITFKRLLFSMKRGYEDVFVFAGMLFMSDYKFNYFFSMERGYRSVLGYGSQVKTVPGLSKTNY